jgi:nucleotide-binding universal stress UspA family protein
MSTATTTGPARGPILVGVGDTDETPAALAFAASEAVRRGLRIRVVHVLRPPSPLLTDDTLIDYHGAMLVAQDLVAAAAERLDHLTGGGVTVERLVRRGRTASVLTELAAGAEMVVLQHRERTLLERVVAGSVVVDVAGRSPVPVVSAPERWRPGHPIGEVLVAVDGHRGQEALLERAFAMSAAHGAGLSIVHAWFLGTAYDEVITSRTPIEQWAELAHQRVVERTASLRAQYPAVSVRIDVRHQPAADAIVAASRHSDLVLIGRRYRRHGPHLGAVARAVLSASRVPVVVVPGAPVSAITAAGDEVATAHEVPA